MTDSPNTTGCRPATDVTDLAAAIAEFEAALPGWWWSLGMCSLTRDASCGPDRTGPDAGLLALRLFDDGFHHDDRDGDVAGSLRIVMAEALAARASYFEEPANGR